MKSIYLLVIIFIVAQSCDKIKTTYFDNGKKQFEYITKNDSLMLIKEYYKDGSILGEAEFINGKRNGLTRVFLEKGILKKEYTYKDGIRNGFQREYFLNEIIEEEYYLDNDTLNGNYINYYDNGQLHTKGEFRKNLKYGDWIKYYPNGKIMTFGKYNSNGLMVGLWKYFDKNNQLTYEIEWFEYIDTTFKIGLNYPVNWKRGKHPESIFYAYNPTDTCSYKSNFGLIKYNVSPKNVSLKKFTENLDERLMKDINIKSEIIKKVETKINDLEVIWELYNISTVEGSRKLISFNIKGKRDIYILTFGSIPESFDYYLPIFNEIAYGFIEY